MKSIMHRISIPTILETGPDTTKKLGALLKRCHFTKIALFYDDIIQQIFGSSIESILQASNIQYNAFVFDTTDYCEITSSAFEFPQDVQAFVALGGGKVLDAVKYMAFIRKLPFISIPTSTSNDGFCSPVSSLLINGKRTTVPSRIPYGIIVDTQIIKSAPQHFIYSGIGDLVSNITALWDWRYEEAHHKSQVDHFAAMISEKSVQSCIHSPFSSIQDDEFLQDLVYSLAMNGIAMEISGSSAPASGSEHLISHALDKILHKPYLHGIQVGIATYLMSLLQENAQKEISTFFNITGFFNYVKNLNIPKHYFIEAIQLAPSIKPERSTLIHNPTIQNQAILLLDSDPILKILLH